MSRVLERDLYQHDFFAWTRRQSKALRRFARTRPNLPLDLLRIAAEIAGLGKEQRSAVRSWTIRIIEHLLLLEHSPAQAPRRGWLREVPALRDEIEDRLTPTLRRDLERQPHRLRGKARRPAPLDMEPHEGAPHGQEGCWGCLIARPTLTLNPSWVRVPQFLVGGHLLYAAFVEIGCAIHINNDPNIIEFVDQEL